MTEAEKKAKECAEKIKEKEKFQNAMDKANKRAEAREKHNGERIAKIKQNPDGLFWQLAICGAGVMIIFEGFVNLRFTVPRDPEYLSVENVMERLGFYRINDTGGRVKAFFEDSTKGDKLRATVFEAYQNAMNVYSWCKKKKCEIWGFDKKVNPEFFTMFDDEVKEFFKDFNAD